ncbi:BICD family-like cargo adapter 2 [Ascaphus truei]|uniref:BICD family-like cargo adapter 2 n=1 Tax=Ascaphus truei TaxID=8439 RepID=UPI003F59C53D
MEMELEKCRLERDSLSRQLLSSITQKVSLSQELEAWQDDMQIIITQQLKSQREQDALRLSETSLTPPRRRESKRQRDAGSIFSFFNRK